MVTENTMLNPHLWVKEHADYLYKYTISRVGNQEQAKDLVQETFLAGIQNAGKFQGRSSERTWLTSILKNKIVDVYRRNSTGLMNSQINNEEQELSDFFESPDGHWNGEHAPHEFGIEGHDQIIKNEFYQILKKCMEKLPGLWMSVFTMKHLEEETTDFICSELKLTASNFWVIIHRTKLNLRACLQKNWIG